MLQLSRPCIVLGFFFYDDDFIYFYISVGEKVTLSVLNIAAHFPHSVPSSYDIALYLTHYIIRRTIYQ